MDNSEHYRILEKEYIKNYKKILYWPMKIMGFARFDIKDNTIVELTLDTLIYRTILLLITDIGLGYLVYTSVVTRDYLKVPDGMVIIHFGSFANMLLINLSFLNRRSGLNLINQSFEIDIHLGPEESKFMRNIEVKTFTWWWILIAFTNVSGGVFLYKAYDVSMTIHIVGSLYFFWLFFCYDDYCFAMKFTTFVSVRARYLNLALAKAGGMNINYLSDKALLNILFWNKSYDDLVTFDCRASLDDYRVAFEMVFKMSHLVETIYRFPLGLALWTIIVGTFVTSQTFIERIKNPNVSLDQVRTYITIGWSLISWIFIILISSFLDLFSQQIEQTRLICVCIQLKPNMPSHIYKLSKTVLRVLDRRSASFKLYNFFVFDAGFILKMAAATFVYITVQLQLAFPGLPNPKSNITTSD